MLIHGRLILTAHGFMLDEVKSLLQKSLRRKEQKLALQACDELVADGKKQLTWKSLITFLFEDHCLSDASVLRQMLRCYHNKDVRGAVVLLLGCATCRVAACIPVVTLYSDYEPVDWRPELMVPDKYQRLLASGAREIDCGLLLVHLEQAWSENNHRQLMTYFKMATIVEDIMDAAVTGKGVKMLLKHVNKPRPTHVFLSVLKQLSSGSSLQPYIIACYELSCVPGVCLRLLLCSVLTQRMFKDHTHGAERVSVNGHSERLTHMPVWAVDKHTFRGKFGKGSKHLVKKRPAGMSDEALEEFHGNRSKRGLQHFFDEGCICKKEAMAENPFWEKTKDMYFSKTPRLQKTARMTKIYYDELIRKYPGITMSNGQSNDSSKLVKNVGRKRHSESNEEPAKKRKVGDERHLRSERSVAGKETASIADCERPRNTENEASTAGNMASIAENMVSTAKNKASTAGNVTNSADHQKCSKRADQPASKTYGSLGLRGPLLQLPTGSAKVYTCADLTSNQVIKGPYSSSKQALTMWYHRALADGLSDPHTLPVTEEQNYMIFPLYKATNSPMNVTTRDFYDAISKSNIIRGKFIAREALGIVQLHRLPLPRICNVPMSFWAHYIFRTALNIGDSGLYNSISDSELSFLYGIDMEEKRKTVRSKQLLDLMFVKRPAIAYCKAIIDSISQNKQMLLDIINRPVDFDKLHKIAAEFPSVHFDQDTFVERIVEAKNAIEKL